MIPYNIFLGKGLNGTKFERVSARSDTKFDSNILLFSKFCRFFRIGYTSYRLTASI